MSTKTKLVGDVLGEAIAAHEPHTAVSGWYAVVQKRAHTFTHTNTNK